MEIAKSTFRGPIELSPDCELVSDPDEEIFILYSEKQINRASEAADTFRGLGYVDTHKDVLELEFELTNLADLHSHPDDIRRKRRPKAPKDTNGKVKTIEIQLYQDKTALRSRKGDTGSVLWKASIDFAQMILQDYYSHSERSLMRNDALECQHVLELGAGTGLLSVALSPLVRKYTVTDIGALIPLIQKNITINSSSLRSPTNISTEELDWLAISSTPNLHRHKLYDTQDRPVDLLLAVDCLYNPSLIPPFVATLDYLTTPGRTAVLVVSELRSEDVMREFLEAWLRKEGWEVWRVPNDKIGQCYVIWLGWKPGSPVDVDP